MSGESQKVEGLVSEEVWSNPSILGKLHGKSIGLEK
jgi:hypothetical protein